ncbi:MAG: 50S ribosomal protein L23 [Puniceicoccales bacterium]|jgi:large subunit ribosomal protein L23|nr:50S ribosomal protein L23 [Puniceicoccales bacterium]
MKNFEILKELLLTEKSNLMLSEEQRYVFAVAMGTNKCQIAEAVEMAFQVKVASVNVMNYRGKAKRVRSKTRNRHTVVGRKKKAIVVLKEGYKIDVA